MTSNPIPTEKLPIESLIASRAHQTPDAPIFHFKHPDQPSWRTISWVQLQALLQDARQLLQQHGVGQNDVVGLFLPTSVSWEILHLTCLLSRITLVGLDCHEPVEVLRQKLARARVTCLVTDSVHNETLDTAQLTMFERLLVIDRADERVPLSQRSVLRHCGPVRGVCRDAAQAPAARDALATVVFTSGTTGSPKAIAYTSQQIDLAVSAILDAFPEIGDGSRTVCWLPLSNLFQRVCNLCAIRAGASIYFVSDPHHLQRLLPQIRPSVMIAVPRFFEKVHAGIRQRLHEVPLGLGDLLSRLLDHAIDNPPQSAFRKRCLRWLFRPVARSFGGALRFFVSGSAPMSAALLRAYDAMGLPVFEAYGLSENIVPIAVNRSDAHRYGSVGRPLDGNQLKLADDGELLCRGPGVCQGYLDADDAPRIDADGYLATGDYANIDDDGYVWLTGRKSDVFKTSTGRRIAPTEIEAVITRSSLVDTAVVVGEGHEFLIALVTLSRYGAQGESRSFDASLINDVKIRLARLSPYKRPVGLVVLRGEFSVQSGEFTGNLKLRRKVIATKFAGDIATAYELLSAAKQTARSISTGTALYIGPL